MPLRRVTTCLCVALALVSSHPSRAADAPAPSVEATSTTQTRDQDPVIQEVRGLRNSGMKLHDQKEYNGAIEKLRSALKLLHYRVFGDGRHDVKDPLDISQDAALYSQILNDYGSVLIRGGEYDEAIDVLEDAVAMVEKIYGDSHPSLGLSLRSLADAYMAKKEYKKAIGKYKTLRKHIKRGLGVTHEAYIEASLRIAEGYKKLDKKETALKVLRHAVQAQGEEINGLTMGIAELYMELSTAHVAMNEIEEAQRAAEMASAVFLQRDGEQTLSYAFSLNALAGVKMRQQKVDEAIQLLEHAHRIAVGLYGEHDTITKDSATTLREVKKHKLDLQAEKEEL